MTTLRRGYRRWWAASSLLPNGTISNRNPQTRRRHHHLMVVDGSSETECGWYREDGGLAPPGARRRPMHEPTNARAPRLDEHAADVNGPKPEFRYRPFRRSFTLRPRSARSVDRQRAVHELVEMLDCIVVFGVDTAKRARDRPGTAGGSRIKQSITARRSH